MTLLIILCYLIGCVLAYKLMIKYLNKLVFEVEWSDVIMAMIIALLSWYTVIIISVLLFTECIISKKIEIPKWLK